MADKVQIRYCDIPVYLQAGEFYRNLDRDEPESVIQVPTDCFMADGDRAENLHEFCKLIEVMLFWLLDEPPYGITHFYSRNAVHVWRNTVSYAFGPRYAEEFVQNLSSGSIKIKYCDIPLYLRKGKFYSTLSSDDPNGFLVVPAHCFHPDGQEATSLQEFRQLLRVITFWMLDTIPVAVLDFCNRFEVADWHDLLIDAPDTGEIVPDLLTAYSERDNQSTLFREVVQTGRWDLITHLVSRLDKEDGEGPAVAAQIGNLPLLKYFNEQGFDWDERTCSAASMGGHLDCLMYAHERGCKWDVETSLFSAQYGHLPCLEYAHKHGLEWDPDVCMYAALNGNLECLRYARENGCLWDDKTMVAHAAQYPDTACLLYVLQQGCLPNHTAACLASKLGHIDCLHILNQLNVPLDTLTTYHAAMCSDETCLRYLRDNDCPWDEEIPRFAAVKGSINSLRYAFENGCPYDEYLMQSAAAGYSLECIQYLVEVQGMYMEEDVFILALLRGDLACLTYIIEQGCPYSDVLLEGDDELLELYDRYFRENNPEFVQCLEFAVLRNYVLGDHFMRYVVSKDAASKTWLINNGHFVDDTSCDCALADNSAIVQV